MRLLSLSALGAALISAGLVAPALGEATVGGVNGVTTTPSVARPGQSVDLTVPGCSVGRARHWATSKAFAQDVTLGGKADSGHGTATVKRGLASGTYAIVAHCDGRKVSGRLKVSTKRSWPVLDPTGLKRPEVTLGK
ncbi:hypothetical protein [Actinomadura rudentiformis]|uniref:Uncharacterized protein n=1 Tax=Actinomadura rudentiformis TaxID=359158 RepID=A0A6H9Z452_9ACTN|nr:hypothetical protein [Actinomadura rudentiformis]KAB2350711.1 hypothetical protein F8566_06910 [Actinomadura rudentiformis]